MARCFAPRIYDAHSQPTPPYTALRLARIRSPNAIGWISRASRPLRPMPVSAAISGLAAGGEARQDADRRRCPAARKVPRVRAGRAVCWPKPACMCRAILETDFDAGFMLVTDLGTTSYLSVARRKERAAADARRARRADPLPVDLARRRAAAVRRSVPAPRDGVDARMVRRAASRARADRKRTQGARRYLRAARAKRARASRKSSCCAISCRAI